MSRTPRLSIPFLSAGQAQKELTHNEALQMLDALIATAVEDAPQASAPAAPTVGLCYLVSASPTGVWAGQANKLAQYTAGGWRFIAPVEGLKAHVRTSGEAASFRQGAWEFGQLRGSNLILGGQQVVGGRGAAIASPSGGTTVDSQARSAIGLILASLRQHGLIEP